MRPDGVVVVLPDCQRLAGVSERGEQRLVQQLVAQPAVEALDEGVLRAACRARCSAIRSAVSCDQRRIAMLVSSVPLSVTIDRRLAARGR